ncbi:MAG: transposase [Candidatus Competibacteraceae bacterium]
MHPAEPGWQCRMNRLFHRLTVESVRAYVNSFRHGHPDWGRHRQRQSRRRRLDRREGQDQGLPEHAHRVRGVPDLVTPVGARRQSGKYQGQTRLSNLGDGLLRKALYCPAIVASRYNPLLRAFCARLKAKGKPGKVIVCAVMRKLLTLAYGVLKSGCPFDPEWVLAN